MSLYEHLTEEYYKELCDVSNALAAHYHKWVNNPEFIQFFQEHIHINNTEGSETTSTSMNMFFLFALEVKRIMLLLGYSQDDLGHKLETYGFILLILKVVDKASADNIAYQTFLENIPELGKSVNNVLDVFTNQTDLERGYWSVCAQSFSDEMSREYRISMYRFVSLAAKADGTVNDTEKKVLQELIVDRKPDAPPTGKDQTESAPVDSDSLQTSLKKLDELIGLQRVKDEVLQMTSFIQIQKMRQENGLKDVPISYHCVFTGNPGTGKTTVARILAEIYKSLGILKEGQLIETDRSGLVGEYVGQTATKTNKVINSALDGVLFIDEAYSLISTSEQDYGKEAIATLLKRMEDDRNRLIVILAGYTNEMKQFIDSNPGLQSRFNRFIQFDDYSADELMQIIQLNFSKYEYKLDEAAKEKLYQKITHDVAHKDANFGNARHMRNLFEKILEWQALRLASDRNISIDKLTTITADDIRI